MTGADLQVLVSDLKSCGLVHEFGPLSGPAPSRFRRNSRRKGRESALHAAWRHTVQSNAVAVARMERQRNAGTRITPEPALAKAGGSIRATLNRTILISDI